MRSFSLALLMTSMLVPALAVADKPAGWFLAGSDASYTMERDVSVTHVGRASGRLASIGQPKGFGTMMQSFDPGEYRGKRLKFSAFAKAGGVSRWAGLWMRVDGPEQGRSLAFDNMQARPIKGTKDWTRYDVVLDVADNATAIAFGILLDGPGTVWLDDATFDIVDNSVPTTGGQLKSTRPENLNFEH